MYVVVTVGLTDVEPFALLLLYTELPSDAFVTKHVGLVLASLVQEIVVELPEVIVEGDAVNVLTVGATGVTTAAAGFTVSVIDLIGAKTADKVLTL